MWTPNDLEIPHATFYDYGDVSFSKARNVVYEQKLAAASKKLLNLLSTEAMDYSHWNLSLVCDRFAAHNSNQPVLPGIEKIIQKHKKLKGLYLNNNQLTLETMELILPVISQHPSLEELYLQCNSFGHKGLSAIFKSLESNKKLKVLVTYRNNEHLSELEELIPSFASFIRQNSSVTSFIPRFSFSLDAKSAEQISEALKYNYTLKTLDLFDTQTRQNRAPEPFLSMMHLRIKRNVGGMIEIFFAFLMGFSSKIHKKENLSPIRTAFGKSEIFDRNTLYLIFDFLS